MMDDPESVFSQFPQLETQRLLLRQVRPTDAQAIFDYFADPAVTRYYNLDTFISLSQAERMVDSFRRSYREKQAIRWGIVRKRAPERLLGTCGYHHWARHFFKAEIGYELARPFWGQGIMTEALTAMIRMGIARMDLNRIEALVMRGNDASLRLLRKLGFREEGVLRQYGYWKGAFHDLHMMALLQQDFRPEISPVG